MDHVPDTPAELIASGYKARKEHRPEQAKEIFSEAVRLSRTAADSALLASSLVALGQIERDLNHIDLALQHYWEAVDILRTSPHRLRLAHATRHLADIFRKLGSREDALACYAEALKSIANTRKPRLSTLPTPRLRTAQRRCW